MWVWLESACLPFGQGLGKLSAVAETQTLLYEPYLGEASENPAPNHHRSKNLAFSVIDALFCACDGQKPGRGGVVFFWGGGWTVEEAGALEGTVEA